MPSIPVPLESCPHPALHLFSYCRQNGRQKEEEQQTHALDSISDVTPIHCLVSLQPPFTHSFIHASAHPSVRLSTHVHICSCTPPRTHRLMWSSYATAHVFLHAHFRPCVYPPTHSSTNTSAHKLFHPRIRPCAPALTHARTPSPTGSSTNPCVHASMLSFTHLLTCLSVHLLTHTFILSSGDSFIHSLLCDTFKFSVRSEDWVYFLLRSFNTSEVNTAVFHPTQ